MIWAKSQAYNKLAAALSPLQQDFSTVEVHLYETKTGNMYIHHDISLPSFPLCLAHGKSVGESKGNYCAVGMFTPGIEIWNLDVLDALEPVCVLGGTSATKTSKKSKKSTETLVNGSHSDAIMALSWNPIHRNILASASADTTVKLWDVSSDPIDKTGVMGPAATFSHHTDKVQAVQWHPTDGSILATGSFDKSVAIVDARCKDGGNFRKARLPADCESIAWDPCQTHNLSVACEDGTVICWDVRNGFGEKDGESWSFVAHDFGGVSDLAYNR
jgi:periodic tryptophan protein 1